MWYINYDRQSVMRYLKIIYMETEIEKVKKGGCIWKWKF